MSDEEGDRDLPGNRDLPSTSEATPPEAEEDSPEMVNQPSPPEEERVSSSTDVQQPRADSSPEEPSISSTEQQPPPTPPRQGVAGTSRGDSPNLRVLLLSNEAINPRRRSQEAVVSVDMLSEALRTPPVLEYIHVGEAMVASRATAQGCSNLNIGEGSDEDSQQLDVPLEPICSPGNVDLRTDLSPTESSGSGEGSGGSSTEGSGGSSTEGPVIGGSSTKVIIVVVQEGSSGTSATENIGIKDESSPSKPGSSTPVSGSSTMQDVRIKDELSPSKTSASIPISGAGSSASASPVKKLIDVVSPKRKSSCEYQHLTPKRSSPLASPGKPRKQSDSQMSSLLGDLEIEEKQGSSESVFGREQVKGMELGDDEKPKEEAVQGSIEMEETEESKKEETDQGSMETEESEESQKEAEQESDKKMKKKDASEKEQ